MTPTVVIVDHNLKSKKSIMHMDSDKLLTIIDWKDNNKIL